VARKVKKAQPKKVKPAQQPLVQGSALTVGDANRQAKNATNVRYGAQTQGVKRELASQQQLNQDTAGWYEDYKRELAQHHANVAQNTANQNTANQQLLGSVKGLDSDAQTDEAKQAAGVRQMLLGSYGTHMASLGRSATDYADAQAHVVAPGQKLQAQAQGGRNLQATRQKLTDLRAERGAYRQSFLDSLTADERKSVLAAAVAGQDYALDAAKVSETIRSNKADEHLTKKKIRAQKQAAANDPSKQKTAADLAFFKEHGYYPPTGPPKDKSKDPAKEPLTRNEQNHVIEPIQNAQSWISRLKAQKKTPTQIRQILLTGFSQKASDGKASLTIPSYDKYAVNAAMDLVYNGYLSPANVHELRRRGVKPARYFPVKPQGHVKSVFG
jgi:hypothetical protein